MLVNKLKPAWVNEVALSYSSHFDSGVTQVLLMTFSKVLFHLGQWNGITINIIRITCVYPAISVKLADIKKAYFCIKLICI